jgi:hypothetical protein
MIEPGGPRVGRFCDQVREKRENHVVRMESMGKKQ